MVGGEADNDCDDQSKNSRKDPLEAGKRFRAPTQRLTPEHRVSTDLTNFTSAARGPAYFS
jgi:hypothetical protein